MAVLVIQFASVQHAFWVVLATLSVLRSNALGTGTTVFWAVAGTTAGIVVGGALIYVVGTHDAVLWGILPFVVLLAAYAPRAISFAAGQAGFTVVLLIVFNIIAPAGWQVGLLRAEDVAIGCGISLAVGVLFWPRGAETLVRQSLGRAYARASDYVAAATRRLADQGEAGEVASSARAARAAAERLDDAFRQYLAEPSSRARTWTASWSWLRRGSPALGRLLDVQARSRPERTGFQPMRRGPHGRCPRSRLLVRRLCRCNRAADRAATAALT